MHRIKFERIGNPQSLEDYGLSMTETELREVQELKSFFESFGADDIGAMMEVLGAEAGNMINNIILKVIKNDAST